MLSVWNAKFDAILLPTFLFVKRCHLRPSILMFGSNPFLMGKFLVNLPSFDDLPSPETHLSLSLRPSPCPLLLLPCRDDGPAFGLTRWFGIPTGGAKPPS